MPAQLTSPFLLVGLGLAAAGLVLGMLYCLRPSRLLPWAVTSAFLLSLSTASSSSECTSGIA